VLFGIRKSKAGRILFDAPLFERLFVFLTPPGFTGNSKQKNWRNDG